MYGFFGLEKCFACISTFLFSLTVIKKKKPSYFHFFSLFPPFPVQIFGNKKQNDNKVTFLLLYVKTRNTNRKSFLQMEQVLKYLIGLFSIRWLPESKGKEDEFWTSFCTSMVVQGKQDLDFVYLWKLSCLYNEYHFCELAQINLGVAWIPLYWSFRSSLNKFFCAVNLT